LAILFDTSVAIGLREGQTNILNRTEALGQIPLLSIISVVELEGGVRFAPEGLTVRRAALDRILAKLEILPFERAEAAAYRMIVENLGFSRRQTFDRMIAAQALVAEATLVTLNPRDFRGIRGLTTEDWSI
jgi:tRNA(fMet)-specific endonuclease VapC